MNGARSASRASSRSTACALAEIARRFGTPCYVYSRAAIEAAYREFDDGPRGRRPPRLLRGEGELQPRGARRAARAWARASTSSPAASSRACSPRAARADRVIFSGVGKSEAEIRAALAARHPLLQRGERAGARAPRRARRRAGHARRRCRCASTPTSTRAPIPISPPASPATSSASRTARALEAYRRAARLPNLRVTGIDCHIGSQILETAPLDEALERVLELVERARARGHRARARRPGRRLRHPLPRRDAARRRAPTAARLAQRLAGQRLPGAARARAARIVGNAGVLLTRVEYLKLDKAKRFAVVDASMSELIRPALYAGVARHRRRSRRAARARARRYDVVGPVCESSDVLGTDRALAVDAGRPPRDPVGRRLRDGDGVELQLAPAPLRGARRRAARASKCARARASRSLFALESASGR